MPAPNNPSLRQNVSEQIEAINLLELEMKARELLPQTAYDYYASGANDEVTLHENRAAYERMTLLPHVLVDVSDRHIGHDRAGRASFDAYFDCPHSVSRPCTPGRRNRNSEGCWRS